MFRVFMTRPKASLKIEKNPTLKIDNIPLWKIQSSVQGDSIADKHFLLLGYFFQPTKTSCTGDGKKEPPVNESHVNSVERQVTVSRGLRWDFVTQWKAGRSTAPTLRKWTSSKDGAEQAADDKLFEWAADLVHYIHKALSGGRHTYCSSCFP